jgi:ABC-2 type transport system permease protein
VKGTVTAAMEPAALFRLHGIKALFRFPPGFARDVRRPGGARVQVLIDGSDPNLGTIIRNASEPMLLGATLVVLKVEQPKVLDLRTLILYNPEQRSALFFVPGLMAVILLMISALLTSVAIAREKELGTMGQLLVSPLRPLEIIVGKIIPYLFLAAVDGILVLVVGRLAFDVRIEGNPWFLGLCSLAYVFTALSIGLLISTIAKRQQHAMFMALGATMMPTVLLSGFIFPVASMPVPLQVVSGIIPATYFLEIVRGIILKGVGLRELWAPLLILTAEGMIVMAVAIGKFKVKL